MLLKPPAVTIFSGAVRLLILLAAILASGCTDMPVRNAALLENARQASGSAFVCWEHGVYGMNALITPQVSTYDASNVLLNAVYRTNGETTRFAIFLPQGSKLGQCERVDKKLACSSSDFPYSNTLVRTSFAALDEIFNLRPLAGDLYDLQSGSSTTENGDTFMLRRQRFVKDYRYLALYATNGDLLIAVKSPKDASERHYEDQIGWKAEFKRGQPAYRFIPQNAFFTLDVTIVNCQVRP